MTRIPGFHSSQEIVERFGVNRSRVSAIAKDEEWKPAFTIGRTKFYADHYVNDYAANRTRTSLAKELSIHSGASLYRDSDYDIQCPVCGEFAIERPPTADEMKSEAWQSGEYSTEWLCVNGHSNSKEK